MHVIVVLRLIHDLRKGYERIAATKFLKLLCELLHCLDVKSTRPLRLTSLCYN